MPPLIIVFLKWPEPGRVKTRLARSVGDEEAVRIYRGLVREVGRCLAQCQGTEVAICYSPANCETSIRDWITRSFAPVVPIHWWPQPESGLGERQAFSVQAAFAAGYEKVALIGTDCIDLTPELFASAWEALDTADWAFAPANDGGYCLAAIHRRGPTADKVFANVRWSSESTLGDCQANLESVSASFLILETLLDIDDYDDWRLVADRVDLEDESAPRDLE